jgi:hypothetical protein
MVNPVTKQWIVFLPDMPHLTKILSLLLSCHCLLIQSGI